MIIYILFVHFLADFVFQTNKMFEIKHKRINWLSLHVLFYTLITTIGWSFIINDIKQLDYLWGVIFLTHWVIDFIMHKLINFFKINRKTRYQYLTTGLEQFIHSATLIYIYQYINNII